MAAALFSGGVNLLYLSSPLYLMQVYNRVLASGSMPTLIMLTLILGFALATMGMLDAIRARVLNRVGLRFDRLLAPRVLGATIGQASRLDGSARSAQPLRDLDQVRSTIAGPAIHFLFDAPWTPLYLGMLFLIHPLLGATAAVGALTLFVLAAINEWSTRKRIQHASEAASRTYGFTESVVRHAEVISAMGMRGNIEARWNQDRRPMLADQAGAADINASATSAIRFCRLLLQAAMLGIGAWLAIGGAILPATIFAASIIMARALAPVEQAVGSWRQITGARQALARLRLLLRSEPAPASRMKIPLPEGGLSAADLSFSLPGRRRPLLDNVSFSLGAGEMLGVIGPSAAGKSTLAKLLAGALEPTEGEIRLGGIDIRRWAREDLGPAIGYLPQEAGLLPGSIRDNIARFGGASDDEVIEAARRSGVHQMILDLADGYDTHLGEGGAGLSGGQRQRIGLARAIIGSPRLIVLDEPNAHLDADGERSLVSALEELKQDGATIVVIAHRPSIIATADRLMVIQGGEVSAFGPRAEIVETLRRQTVRPVASNAPREIREDAR
jgi:ATP-binding cassette subfamily C exporter for protease/lipase